MAWFLSALIVGAAAAAGYGVNTALPHRRARHNRRERAEGAANVKRRPGSLHAPVSERSHQRRILGIREP